MFALTSSGATTRLGPQLVIDVEQGAQTGTSEMAILDASAARSKLSATAGALTSGTLTEDGEFALVSLAGNSAVFAFRSGNTIYGVSSNTSRAV